MITKITSTEILKAVQDAAINDNHLPLCLTHAILNNAGVVIGAVSVEAMPIVSLWVHSTLARKRDILKAINDVQILPKSDAYITMCAIDSPFRGFMESKRFGCKYIGNTDLFMKLKPQAKG